MKLPRCTVTNSLLLLTLFFTTAVAYAAQVVGTVTHLSGPLLVKKSDGTVKVLSQKSSVEKGDTLISKNDTYARIKFTDNSEITLKPNSQFKIDNFVFDAAAPEKDNAAFSLVQGGLRAITGILGKRNKERFGLNTPTATIGIRGTIFIAEYIPPTQSAQPNQPAVASYAFASMAAVDLAGGSLMTNAISTRSDTPNNPIPLAVLPKKGSDLIRIAQVDMPVGDIRAPGLYLQVQEGFVNVSNNAGSQVYAAGQFGYAPDLRQPPMILPHNPGMQFSPPPAFSSSTVGRGGQTGDNLLNGVDCEVR